jgi:hypothetical protein
MSILFSKLCPLSFLKFKRAKETFSFQWRKEFRRD